FTVVGDGNANEIQLSMERCFELIFAESGIRYSFESFHSTEGSIIANVQFVGPLNFTNRIKHDISLKEKLILNTEPRRVRTDFPDLLEFEVLSYSLREILIEKLRSIMQRGYSRDYYDVWRLLKDGVIVDPAIEEL